MRSTLDPSRGSGRWEAPYIEFHWAFLLVREERIAISSSPVPKRY